MNDNPSTTKIFMIAVLTSVTSGLILYYLINSSKQQALSMNLIPQTYNKSY